MSERDSKLEQSISPGDNETETEGFLYIEQSSDRIPAETDGEASEQNKVEPVTPLSSRNRERAGTIEHLAARKSYPEIDKQSPELKRRLSTLRTEVTRILTSLRWEGQSIEETARQLVPLLNIGPIPQWRDTLIPFLYEIDRGGALIPVWLTIIEQGDPTDQPPDTNPGETAQGRARRYAILMLGNYRTMGIAGTGSQARFASRKEDGSLVTMDLAQYLGSLATDPDVSLYACHSLVKHATMASMQALIGALKEARGWAKVDVVKSCLDFQQERFYDILIDNGLEHAVGLENYIALPLYRAIPLERYLENKHASPRLRANAALIVQQVLVDSNNLPLNPSTEETQPPIFNDHFPVVAQALLQSATYAPDWQHAVALHQLGILMGRYWSEINKNTITDPRILKPIYQVLPLMNEVERWMNGPGRDALLQAIANPEEEKIIPIARALGELKEPRATTPIIERLEITNSLRDRAHALTIGALCDTLGRIGDRRAAAPMFQLLTRTVDLERRRQIPKRAETLPQGDPNIPGSIVYAAVVHACGQIGDPGVIEGIWDATRDVDPYVRTQGLEALKLLDPQGEREKSRVIVRQALLDPRASVVRTAASLVRQYRDTDAAPILQQVADERTDLTYELHDTLRQLT
ncbi:HEAT repeat domain-containing protein [Dictyobacter aurantiacus]|uniref:HEAT repeat domain-containing protein n=1 Tax=Dictyobacter aurantiacus TaxID=1936993 RepID=A0A401ZG51_9CHLR|nr:HEAT repeat domain-containing protein [Dictyobacter aurantiacus]GCE05816.1 hypothetical protein KDAU_31450 [Dictyobacter aurantiacus]